MAGKRQSEAVDNPGWMERIQGKAAALSPIVSSGMALQLAKRLRYQIPYQDIDPQLRLFLAVRNALGQTEFITEDTATSRLKLRHGMQTLRRSKTPVRAVTELAIPLAQGSMPARWYVPEEEDSQLPLMMFIHGGGFIVGDLDTHDEACRMLARYGHFQIVSIDYRRAPEHPAPAALDDAIAGFQWLQNNTGRFGKKRGQISVGGDSAGGNLAAVVSQQLAGTADAPCAQLLIYPVIDLFGDYPSKEKYGKQLVLTLRDCQVIREQYVNQGTLPADDPRICPLNGKLSGLAPALVVTSAFDMLRDEGEAYAHQLRKAGTTVAFRRVASQGHGFMNITPVNESAKWATIQLAQDFAMLCRGELPV